MTPSADFQLGFLSKLQRIFNEGEFVATYKYALINSIADLCIDYGTDTDQPHLLPFKDLGKQFITYYWQQSQPFLTGHDEGAVLFQSHGRQASVISAIREFRQRFPRQTLNSAPTHPNFPALLSRVVSTIRQQPIKYLQNVSGLPDSFIFDSQSDGLLLKPGISFCFRRFHPLITQVARSQWITHVRGISGNAPILGTSDDLEAFMFSTSRQALSALKTGLTKLQGQCFYCQRKVSSGGDIDHFVPFSLYPRDMVPNFVLAHASCNRSKSNHLASSMHLQNWLEFNRTHSDDLLAISHDAGIRFDQRGTLSVALWAYQSVSAAGGYAWRSTGDFVPVTAHDVSLLQVEVSSTNVADSLHSKS
jgi:5-methylcytosine-specific restriction endonuclease McrA